MALRGFRTKIALHVVLLLLLSAILTYILLVVIVQRGMVQDHLNTQEKQILAIGFILLDGRFLSEQTNEAQKKLAGIVDITGNQWPLVMVVDNDGQILYQKVGPEQFLKAVQTSIDAAVRIGKPQTKTFGMTWSLYWWQPEHAVVVVPVLKGGHRYGTAAALVPLKPVYDRLRQYNRPVFIYIVLNTVVLATIGLYRIFRIYLRPIDRIVRQADDYGSDDDLFFAFRQEDDELNRLSSSLNRMLIRIAADKRKLTETVSNLEQVNRELRRAQNEIIRAEKLASVGRLAAGIAHEIGNPIGIVLGYLDLLKQDDLDSSERESFAQRSEQEIQRINTIIRQLLDLARPKTQARTMVSLHNVIEAVVDVMDHQPMMADIELTKQLLAEQDTVKANEDQLHQVFLNLLLNAVDAIRESDSAEDGRIIIRTSVDDRSDESDGEAWLTIQFQDNGKGIDADQVETIFDPFYTTKEPGKGTGLGLAVSYMIIEEINGTITASSNPGHGTTMTIALPLPAAAQPTGDAMSDPAYGAESENEANDK